MRPNRGLLVADEHGDGHKDAAQAYVRTQPLAYPRALPKDARQAGLVAVEDGGEYLVHVGAGADEQEDDQEETLEVEEGGHAGGGGLWAGPADVIDSVWI